MRVTTDQEMNIEAQEATLHYEDDGPKDAPAVLLWNGAQCTIRMWDQVVDQLKTEYRFIRFDIRGTGSSVCKQGGQKLFSLEQYCNDANLILEQQEVDKVIIWSMAWGSRAAIAYCSLNLDRITNAVLNDASVDKADPNAQRLGAKAALEKQIASGIPKFEKPAGYNTNPDADLVTQALAAAARFDLKSAAKTLSMPLKLVTGDHDPNLISSREIDTNLANASLTILKNVGHGSILQRPDLCVDEFRNFQNDAR